MLCKLYFSDDNLQSKIHKKVKIKNVLIESVSEKTAVIE